VGAWQPDLLVDTTLAGALRDQAPSARPAAASDGAAVERSVALGHATGCDSAMAVGGGYAVG
jgi:hypothetical protein